MLSTTLLTTMALAETLVRKINKLGLIPKAVKLLPVVSFVLALSSLGWLLVLPSDGNYRNSYISENALMPSQVTSYFRESEWNIVRGFREELEKFETKTVIERNHIIEEWLDGFGLLNTYHKNGVVNDTLYSIMHAPRGDDTEAMVLTVPWMTSDQEYNLGGMALAMALARYFSKASIWSKNIIFVFPQDSHIALRSWVEAYHTSLENTAGSIDAAIVMEYGKNGDYFDYYELSYEGLNGQLPNLDLLNTANLIGFHESLKCSIQGTPAGELQKNTYFTRLRTLFKGILSLTLSGLRKNTPGCEAFSGWQIQSFTIKARGNSGPADVTQFGRMIDSTFRSVNNLLEKFHQSFFFYLMLSPKNFVSIGTYLPSAALMAGSFALSSLGTILNCGVKVDDLLHSLGSLLSLFTVVEVGALLLSVLLPYLATISSEDEVASLQILYAFLLADLVISFLPLTNLKLKKFSKQVTFGLISLSLFFIAMLIITLLIVHFSLALLVGIFALPLTFVQPLIMKVQSEKVTNMVKTSSNIKRDPLSKLIGYVNTNKSQFQLSLCLLVSNPFFILFVGGGLFGSETETILLMRGLLTSWHELQCWTWFVVILCWFPAWLGVGLACVLGEFDIDYDAVITEVKKIQ